MASTSFIVLALVVSEPSSAAADEIDLASLAKIEYRQVDLAPLPAKKTDAADIVSLAVLQDEPAGAPAAFGAADTWRWNIFAGYGIEFDDSDEIYGRAGLGVSYFMIDNLSLDLELNGMYFDQKLNDPWGINFNLLFRWHFIAKKNWSIYLDGGAGLLGTTNDVPDKASSFNFTPQVGLGATYALSDTVRLMAGGRWHHISNANTYESNPGRDSFEFYAGLSWPF